MRPASSTIAWLLVPAGTLVAFLAACAAGLYVGGAVGVISLLTCAVVSAWLILRRHAVADALLDIAAATSEGRMPSFMCDNESRA